MSHFPNFHSRVHLTPAGTPYLTGPGVITLAVSQVNLAGMADFLDDFDPSLGFDSYLQDPDPLTDLEQLAKTAGQLCYMSFGPGRTKNNQADKYLHNIKSSGHGSVLEHPTVSFLFYGISRSLTHELVRHRAGTGFSQVSQRYVSGSVLRFVERPEYSQNPALHQAFIGRIDRAAREYALLTDSLMDLQQAGEDTLQGETKTDRRKRVQQVARSLLPNETESPMVMTANIRAWRHIIEMRASPHAEPEIRNLAYMAYLALKEIAPLLFSDYEEASLPDGTHTIDTPHRKV